MLRDHVMEHSVKHGEFTLKSGATSNWFLDTKQTACTPDGIIAVTDAVFEVFADVFDDIDAIGGPDDGRRSCRLRRRRRRRRREGTDCAASASARRPSRVASPGRIAGALRPGDRVLVTEDTTTRGTSLIEAAEQIEAFGAIPVWMTVIVDRGGTCAAMAADHGIDYRPLLTAPDLGFGYGT